MVSIEAGVLRLMRQGLDEEGTIHLVRFKEDVGSAVGACVATEGSSRTAALQGMNAVLQSKPWRERKRLFDPGGEWGVSMLR